MPDTTSNPSIGTRRLIRQLNELWERKPHHSLTVELGTVLNPNVAILGDEGWRINGYDQVKAVFYLDSPEEIIIEIYARNRADYQDDIVQMPDGPPINMGPVASWTVMYFTGCLVEELAERGLKKKLLELLNAR